MDNIDFSKGQAAFISYQSPAWHGWGKVFNKAITIEQALTDSGLAFYVQKSPNIHRIPVIGRPDEYTDIQSTTSFFTYRTDTGNVLGARLGPDYTVYQNTAALSIVDELLKTKKVSIETVGALYEGRKIFTCLKLHAPLKVGASDEIDQYVLLANSHDGSMAITAMPTNVRVVCANTLSAALAGAQPSHKIRHTANAETRVKEAFQIMGLLEGNSKANSAAYNAMKCNVLTKQEFFDYIGNIFMTPEEIAGLQKGENILTTRKKNIISDVIEFAETGIGQREALGNNLNMWYAYNAVTGYLTGKKYSSLDDRFESMMFGDSSQKIRNAGNLALTPNSIQPLKRSASKGLNYN